MSLRAAVREAVRSHLSAGLRFALRQVQEEWRIQRRHRASVRHAGRLLGRSPVWLNLASGHHPKPGWINVDLFAPGADLRLDLREPMPFPDRSIDRIYVEHFFEHLNYPSVFSSDAWRFERPSEPSEAMAFLRECRRILKDQGRLDLLVPDAEGMIGVYIQRTSISGSEDWWGPRWCDTAMHQVNYLFRQGREHKYAYDEETLERVLSSAGFVGVSRRPFDPAVDQPDHEIGSLCMTATTPASPDAESPNFLSLPVLKR
jgi:predicted SAM-dependent methyltransferase